MIEIKNRWTGTVIFRSESATTTREALEEAVRSGASLEYANLGYANLGYANLESANLESANLGYANLARANLARANLECANLARANLGYANLARADLARANLESADLARANFESANLESADLEPIRDDICSILDLAPTEVAALLAALRDGRVNGSIYEGPCACLLGTIANARGCAYTELGIAPDSTRAAERWFLGIGEGDTPANNQVSRITVEWVEQWLAEHAKLEAGEAAMGPVASKSWKQFEDDA